MNINSQQDIPESPIINGKDFARLGTNSRSVTTPTLTNSINIDRKRKISELGDSQSMVDVNTTLKDIKNAIVECSTKRRGINDIFGEFVAAQLDFFEKEDSEIYNGLQEEISSIIWGARRKLFHLKEQCM